MNIRRLMACVVALAATASTATAAERPNILWFISEDASPHIGCYGETTIRTPNLDQLAADGVRFANAFTTAPVCSPSRSAIVAGMYQTTFGSHNHRSCSDEAKAGGAPAYHGGYRVDETIRLVPELFAAAGYYVVNGGKAKTAYNFIPRTTLYQGKDWRERAEGQPFFAQIQLHGGKNRGAKVDAPTDPAAVRLPPYYADVPEMREDWAEYLNSWVACDQEVGAVLKQLEKEGVADSTIVFFLTDHGISHLRGKQFLYDEGARIPLIVRFPDGRGAGTTRTDLVSHIDVAAASLDLAGIEIPGYIQGRPLFSDKHQPRSEVFAARDRCDETPDFIRSVRTDRFKYIRNFLSDVSHTQANQYKDGKQIMRVTRDLLAAGRLNELQSRIFAPTRPVEELYDIQADPWEINNLAGQQEFQEVLRDLRGKLYAWMVETRDVGVVPEPLLEDLGVKLGSRYAVLRQDENKDLVRQVIATIEAGERGDVSALREALASSHAAVRYWAARKSGLLGDKALTAELTPLLDDSQAAVRVAAAEALARLGSVDRALEILGNELTNENLVVGHYAIRAIEALGASAAALGPQIEPLVNAEYDSTQRVAMRMLNVPNRNQQRKR